MSRRKVVELLLIRFGKSKMERESTFHFLIFSVRCSVFTFRKRKKRRRGKRGGGGSSENISRRGFPGATLFFDIISRLLWLYDEWIYFCVWDDYDDDLFHWFWFEWRHSRASTADAATATLLSLVQRATTKINKNKKLKEKRTMRQRLKVPMLKLWCLIFGATNSSGGRLFVQPSTLRTALCFAVGTMRTDL